MAQSVRDVMTPNPRTLDAQATVLEAACVMRDDDIGDVIVCKGEEACGILTDRDIAVRAVAEGRNPQEVTVGEICSRDLVTLAPEDSVDQAIRLMRERALRRLPVIENGRVTGVLSLGDLAIDLDRKSVLADISAAPANT